MSFINSLDIGASALSAQRLRMDVISQNIAMSDAYATEEGDAYRRQMVVFMEKKTFADTLEDQVSCRHSSKYRLSGVKVTQVVEDETPLVPVYDPENPAADEEGYIYMPNVDKTKESMDMLAAQRSYEANVSAIAAVKAMLTKAMELGK
ncbi:MAG: flagellar basal body rod protein FlgC [Ruminococcus sp.]|nr:flagellar basal body rod protein FlgC [Ruminococcus sp.]